MSTLSQTVRLAAPTSKAGVLTFVTVRFTLVITPAAHTFEGFREWATADDFPEHVRVTYCQGEIIIDMSNEEINAHVAVKTELYAVLGALVKRAALGKFYADGVLLSNIE